MKYPEVKISPILVLGQSRSKIFQIFMNIAVVAYIEVLNMRAFFQMLVSMIASKVKSGSKLIFKQFENGSKFLLNT